MASKAKASVSSGFGVDEAALEAARKEAREARLNQASRLPDNPGEAMRERFAAAFEEAHAVLVQENAPAQGHVVPTPSTAGVASSTVSSFSASPFELEKNFPKQFFLKNWLDFPTQKLSCGSKINFSRISCNFLT